jgi:hypothetical protein
MDIGPRAPAIQAVIIGPAALKSRPNLGGWLSNPLAIVRHSSSVYNP